MARLLPVRRTTFVIGTDRTVLKVVSTELRASVHADQALWFLQNLHLPHARGAHAAPHQPPPEARPIGDLFIEPEAAAREPSLVRPYALTAGRTDADVELPLEAPVQAAVKAAPPRWPKNDVRGQILTYCARSRSIAEIAAALSLPLGATRFLVGDLVTQGHLRVNATPADSMTIEERRELLTRTLRGLRAL
jgi:peroxiredoxin Q/BCP